jgi:hypothetical protein
MRIRAIWSVMPAMLTSALSAVQYQGMSSSQRDTGHPLAIFLMISAIPESGHRFHTRS